MTIEKILSQKIRNPRATVDSPNRYIETMYFTKDSTKPNDPPLIYIHGKLADPGAIDISNIDDGTITSNKITFNLKLLGTVDGIKRYRITLAGTPS